MRLLTDKRAFSQLLARSAVFVCVSRGLGGSYKGLAMATVTKVIAVLLMPKHVPDVLKLGKAIVAAMTGNAYFPTPRHAHADARERHGAPHRPRSGGDRREDPRDRSAACCDAHVRVGLHGRVHFIETYAREIT